MKFVAFNLKLLYEISYKMKKKLIINKLNFNINKILFLNIFY